MLPKFLPFKKFFRTQNIYKGQDIIKHEIDCEVDIILDTLDKAKLRKIADVVEYEEFNDIIDIIYMKFVLKDKDFKHYHSYLREFLVRLNNKIKLYKK